MRRQTGRAVSLFLAAVVVCGALAACFGFDPPPCFPPKYSVEPGTARPGEQVTVSAPDADCNPAYGQDAKIEISLTDAAGREVFTKTGPMNNDGGFTFSFKVPAGMRPGKAGVTAFPHALDWCDDTGRNTRLRRQGAGDDGITRSSCATPVVPLTIKP
ncbi:hypothetical protein [Arthrobacter celericrescens]|uniref:hypothetical protein n=1 Tax=Arthrobacter celericrescens TaxID=2320851 RepID=UPI001FDFABA8|nr:hypothetical protein [Arthrobacter celericrescens]